MNLTLHTKLSQAGSPRFPSKGSEESQQGPRLPRPGRAFPVPSPPALILMFCRPRVQPVTSSTPLGQGGTLA